MVGFDRPKDPVFLVPLRQGSTPLFSFNPSPSTQTPDPGPSPYRLSNHITSSEEDGFPLGSPGRLGNLSSPSGSLTFDPNHLPFTKFLQLKSVRLRFGRSKHTPPVTQGSGPMSSTGDGLVYIYLHLTSSPSPNPSGFQGHGKGSETRVPLRKEGPEVPVTKVR